MEIIQFIILFFTGIIAGFIGSITGMGGTIAIPTLIFLGFNPSNAIANLKLASVGLNVVVIRDFIKSKKIVWTYFIPFTIIMVSATLLTAYFVISLPEQTLNILITSLLFFSLIIIFLDPKTGITKRKVTKTKKKLGYGFLSIATFFGTFIGGLGILKYFIVSKFFGLKYIESNASLRVPWIISGIILTIIFLINGLISFPVALTLMAGNLIGGHIGVLTEVKKGDKWVKKFFIVIIIIIIAAKLFFNI